MPDTFQAVAVLVLALLPGALYVWAFERQVGRWGIGLADRLLRFVGGSAVFHAAVAPLSYWLWAEHGAAVRSGAPVTWWLWCVPAAYVGLPTMLGTAVGEGVRHGRRWRGWLVGPNPAPRAWDHLFGRRPDGWVRLRMRSGTWFAGVYAEVGGRRPYAARYPEVPDLFLSAAADIDQETGEFLLDETGHVRLLEGAILVRWDEVEYLEFIHA